VTVVQSDLIGGEHITRIDDSDAAQRALIDFILKIHETAILDVKSVRL
jgi:hypothetical protein